MLAVIETHPVQYHAPVYRALQAQFDIPVTAIYGSDFSVNRYRDREFGTEFAWDTDLLGGYGHHFLSRVDAGTTPDVSILRARGVREALETIEPSAVLLLGYSPAFHRRAWYEAWRYGRPLLFRGETSDIAQTSSAVVRLAKAAGLRLAYQTCSRVLYIGSRARQHYAALGVSASQLVFAPYCVDTAPFHVDEAGRAETRTDMRAHLGLGPADVAVLFSGKLSARKGVDPLPSAVSLLSQSMRKRIVLLFLGDGALHGAIEEACRTAGLPARMLGFQNQRQLSGFYHAADMLVLPSRSAETWGLVVNEALHHGLPCVVSDRVGCAPDLVGPMTGRVCDAESASSLAAAIAEVAADLSGRLGTREHCRSQVAAYTVEAAAAGIADAYRSVTTRAVAA